MKETEAGDGATDVINYSHICEGDAQDASRTDAEDSSCPDLSSNDEGARIDQSSQSGQVDEPNAP